LYLIPNEIGIGRFQPYAEFSSVQPNNSAKRDETEGGVNYVISGHNARISAFAQYGNLANLGTNYNPTLGSVESNYAIKLALQIQYLEGGFSPELLPFLKSRNPPCGFRLLLALLSSKIAVRDWRDERDVRVRGFRNFDSRTSAHA
jgi:hypothetical protein